FTSHSFHLRCLLLLVYRVPLTTDPSTLSLHDALPILAAKITGCCGTSPIAPRRSARDSERMSCPSTDTIPDCGSWNRRSRENTVLLPAPEGPTSATVSPGRTRRSNPSSAGRSGRIG